MAKKTPAPAEQVTSEHGRSSGATGSDWTPATDAEDSTARGADAKGSDWITEEDSKENAADKKKE